MNAFSESVYSSDCCTVSGNRYHYEVATFVKLFEMLEKFSAVKCFTWTRTEDHIFVPSELPFDSAAVQSGAQRYWESSTA